MSVSKPRHRLLRNAACILALAFTWGATPKMAYAQRQSAITSFYDFTPYGPAVHVVYQDVWGGIEDYHWDYNGPHPGWNLTYITPTRGINVGQLIGYSDGNQNHVFAIRPDAASNTAHIVEWYGLTTFEGYRDLTASAQTTDQFWEPPTGWVTDCYNGQKCLQYPTTLAGYAEFRYDLNHVFFRSQTGGVKELYRSLINNDVWHDHTLPGSSAAGISGEGLAAEFDGMGIQHVFYTDYDQHVHELYYYNNNWWGNDWTKWGRLGPDDFNGYVAASYDSGTNSSTVFAVPAGSSNQLQTLTHFGTASTLNAFTAIVPNFAPGQPIISYDYVDSSCPVTQTGCTPTTRRETAYIGTDHQIYEFNGYTAVRIPANTTANSCQPSFYSVKFSPQNGVTLTGLWDGNFRHLFFVNYDGGVMDFAASPQSGWTLNDIGCWMGYPPDAQ
jgi:hypothetical protein